MAGLCLSILLNCWAFPLTVLGNGSDDSLDIQNGFLGEPRGRGTATIIFTSIVTLSLCAHTAVHPNTIGDQRNHARIGQKVMLVFWALFFPERVLMTAYRQWSEARQLHAAWSELYPEPMQDSLGKIGAFFVVMGGYCVWPDMADSVFPSILTPQGLLDLVQARLIPKEAIVKKEIKDKGNTDEFGKTLVCIQAIWMLVQCSVRKISGLPLTILEVHAVMHILCAAGMYFFWWNKPLDVNEPIPLIRDQRLAQILSVSCDDYHKFDFQINDAQLDQPGRIYTGNEVKLGPNVTVKKVSRSNSPIDDKMGVCITETKDDAEAARYFIEDRSSAPYKHIPIPRKIDTVIFFHHDGSGNYDIPLGKPSRYSPYKHWGFFKDGKHEYRSMLESEEPGTIALFHGERLVRDGSFSVACDLGVGHELRRSFLNAPDLEILQDVASAARSGEYDEYTESTATGYLILRKKFTNALVYPPLDLRVGDRLRVGRSDNWSAYLKWIIDSEYKFMMLTLLFILYSAGHATAWDSFFPTAIERWCWRGSCIIVGIAPLAFFAHYKLSKRETPQEGETEHALMERGEFRERPSWRKLDPNFSVWEANRSSYLWALVFLVFTLARVYLTIEAFVSLRRMPKDVYRTVGWEGYWPHAG